MSKPQGMSGDDGRMSEPETLQEMSQTHSGIVQDRAGSESPESWHSLPLRKEEEEGGEDEGGEEEGDDEKLRIQPASQLEASKVYNSVLVCTCGINCTHIVLYMWY